MGKPQAKHLVLTSIGDRQNIDTADGSVKALVHNQFNSPMPLYSEEKIAETLSAQTEVLAGGALG